MAFRTVPGHGYTTNRRDVTVKQTVKDFGGVDGDEANLLNGLIALGYDPNLVQSFADQDPNRKFLGDAVVRALRVGVKQADIERALKLTDAAKLPNPEARAKAMGDALAGGDTLPPEGQAVFQQMVGGGAKPMFLPKGSTPEMTNEEFFGKDFKQGPTPPPLTLGTVQPPMSPNAPAPALAPTPAAAPAPAPRPPAAPAASRAPAPAGPPAAVDTTPKLAPNASPDEALQFIREHYGYSAWIFEQPQVRDVLIAAAEDGHWSPARLKGALEGTDFFKQNDGNVVKWLNTDTATQKALVDQKVNDVIAKAQTLGMDLDPERARQIATDSNKFGWDDTQLTKAVGHEYHYNPTMAQKGVAKTIRDTARLYGIPMTDAGLDEWGRRIGSGDSSADDFKVTMIGQAKSLFPTLAADLDRGATVKDIFDPYAKIAATQLGLDENTIDILDPKWQRPLQSTDGKSPIRMSTYDWTKTLRTDATYNWDQTDNARQEASGFAHQIRQSFGLA